MSNEETHRFTYKGLTYIPRGHYVVVELNVPEEEKKGVIIRSDATRNREVLMQMRTEGVIRALGPLAFGDETSYHFTVGTAVAFKKYDGIDINRTEDGRVPTDGNLLRWVRDDEILGIITKESEDNVNRE